MDQTFNIYDLALEYGLDIIETTINRNGYPESLKKAMIGFENFEEAKLVAEIYDLRVTTFFKKDGWQLWVRNSDTTYHPLHITSSDYGDDYKAHYCGDRVRFFEEEIKPCLDNFKSLDDLEAFLRDKRKLYDELDNIDDSQIVISYQDRYFETIDINSMAWSHDTKNYVIGVINDLEDK